MGRWLLPLSAVIFLATSLAIGVRASWLDLRNAFLSSWKTTVPAPVAEQIAIVERETAGANLLITYAEPNPWYPRMWQRIFYPRTVIVLSRQYATPATLARLRERYGILYVVSMGTPPRALEDHEMRDLGLLLGSDHRVWFGPLER